LGMSYNPLGVPVQAQSAFRRVVAGKMLVGKSRLVGLVSS
jgi:hypothetical protein